jgi:hypothetical protein
MRLQRAFVLSLLFALPNLCASARAETRRYAVVIGANVGDAQEIRLRFAEADAAKVAHTLRSVGEFPAAQTLQLNGVTADEVRRALIELNARLRQEASDTVLLVYYSGHADAENLHLGGTNLGARELRDIMAGSAAGSRVLIIDACRSGSVTRVKGGSPAKPFAVNLGELAPPTGLAIMTSSAEGEDSQESDDLAGSFFTHYFNSGLIGAADQNHDGLVTLAEAFSFASEQTYRATVTTAAGPQHPTFRFDLGGRQDLVLARPRAPRQGLGVLRFDQAGRYVVHRLEAAGPGPVVAEVAARTSGAQVALPEGKYEIILRNSDHVLEGTAEVRDGAVAALSTETMRRIDYARLVRKGGEVGRGYSLVLAGGLHSAPYTLQGPGPYDSYTMSWRERKLGPALALAVRRDNRRSSFEGRLSYESSHRENNSQIVLDTQMVTAALVGLVAFDIGPVTLNAGGELGLLLMRQNTSQWTDAAWGDPPAPRPSLDLPGQLGTTWSMGPSLGPVVQANLHLWRRFFAQLDAGLPIVFMRVQETYRSTSWESGVRVRFMLGLGCYL